MRPIVGPEQFVEHKELLKKVHSTFNEILEVHPEQIKISDVNDILNFCIKDYDLSETEFNVIQGFYDTYIGMWSSFGDRTAAENLAQGIFNAEDLEPYTEEEKEFVLNIYEIFREEMIAIKGNPRVLEDCERGIKQTEARLGVLSAKARELANGAYEAIRFNATGTVQH